MRKILISACLIGDPVRYDGQCFDLKNVILRRWLDQGRVVSFCPEVSAGLPTPRAAAEIQGGDGKLVLSGQVSVIDNTGVDVTNLFIKGAQKTLAVCLENQIDMAILSESSPSCGSSTIYNGQFEGTKITGSGVTTALLLEHGIRVFSQHQIALAESYFE